MFLLSYFSSLFPSPPLYPIHPHTPPHHAFLSKEALLKKKLHLIPFDRSLSFWLACMAGVEGEGKGKNSVRSV